MEKLPITIPKLYSEKLREQLSTVPENTWFEIDIEDKKISMVRSLIYYVMKNGARRKHLRLSTVCREGRLYAKFFKNLMHPEYGNDEISL